MSGPEDGLSLNQFIKVMLHHLPKKAESFKITLVQNLIELFKQIDINNDGALEWDEFTKHLIELGLVSSDQTSVESEKKYYPSDKEDKETHETEIENLYFVEKLK